TEGRTRSTPEGGTSGEDGFRHVDCCRVEELGNALVDALEVGLLHMGEASSLVDIDLVEVIASRVLLVAHPLETQATCLVPFRVHRLVLHQTEKLRIHPPSPRDLDDHRDHLSTPSALPMPERLSQNAKLTPGITPPRSR